MTGLREHRVGLGMADFLVVQNANRAPAVQAVHKKLVGSGKT